MGRLAYFGISSLDGYTADESGSFDWGAPDAEVHAFVNDIERDVGTYLYGRGMYAVMQYWESVDETALTAVERDYAALWRASGKVVYSRTLESVTTSRTVLERSFEPAAVARLKARSDADLTIGGPALAAQALQAGLVDEVRLILVPVAVGGGKAFFPAGQKLPLALLEERRFTNGSVFLRYAPR